MQMIITYQKKVIGGLKMGRKVARESTMKLLYQMDIIKDFSHSEILRFLELGVFSDDEKEYIKEAAEFVVENLESIDNKIVEYAQGWKINRFAKVDLAILRIAVYEILNREDIPKEVSINEALEISKKYSTSESGKFINGILGSFVRALEKKNG